jgi:putative transposase
MEVIGALAQGQRWYGLPTMIRVDRGSQFTSKEVNLWAYANRITLQSSREADRQCGR